MSVLRAAGKRRVTITCHGKNYSAGPAGSVLRTGDSATVEIGQSFSLLADGDERHHYTLEEGSSDCLSAVNDAENELVSRKCVRKDFVTQDGVDVPLPPGWVCHDNSVLVWGAPNGVPHRIAGGHGWIFATPDSATVASFDFDQCLCKTSFGNDPDDWSPLFPTVLGKLKALNEGGSRVVIFSNESTDRLKKPSALSKKIKMKCGRLQGFQQTSGVPMVMMIALKKDKYRKGTPGPEAGIGMWHLLNDEYSGSIKPNVTKSFFVGDAAGRISDHSDSDKAFAINAGLKFYTESEFFK